VEFQDMAFNPFANTNWNLAHNRQLNLGHQAVVMGILNITPDSFSDGGSFMAPKAAIAAARAMVEEGARIIDIGGESTRPGAVAIDAETEKRRVLPVIRTIARESNIIISVDTYRAETAKAAISEGAHIINDVWGLQKDPEMAQTVADMRAGLVVMHTGRERNVLDDPFDDQTLFLNRSLDIAKKAGISKNAIVLDPGIGFAKDMKINLALMNGLKKLHRFGYPLLIGTSRKRFLGTITGHENASARDAATSATSVIARMNGAAIFRVHNVAINNDALQVADALLHANGKINDRHNQQL